MRRVLLDQGLPPLAAILLREAGWDAEHVAEVALHAARDDEILEAARAAGRICITLDQDFHSIQALHSATSPSVVLIRQQGLDARGVVELIERVWREAGTELVKGAAVSADGITSTFARSTMSDRIIW